MAERTSSDELATSLELETISEITDGRTTRDNAAASYAWALMTGRDLDWARINRAIIEKWSVSALVYIKRKAWAIVEMNSK